MDASLMKDNFSIFHWDVALWGKWNWKTTNGSILKET